MGAARKLFNSVTNSIRHGDSYGKRITFTFNGKETHTTFLGGGTTLLALGATIIYMILLISRLMTYKFVTNSVSTKYQNMFEADPIKMKDYNFSMAFGSRHITYEILTDPHYFWLDFALVTELLDEEGLSIDIDFKFLDYVRCNETETEFKNYAGDYKYLEEYACPVNMDDYELEGVYEVTQTFKYIVIMFSIGPYDKYPDYGVPFEDVATYDGSSFTIKFLNSYFDAEDYENPVKEFIDNRLFDYLDFGVSKQYGLYLSKNTANTKDSPLSISGETAHYEYVDIDDLQRYFEYNSGSNHRGSKIPVKF